MVSSLKQSRFRKSLPRAEIEGVGKQIRAVQSWLEAQELSSIESDQKLGSFLTMKRKQFDIKAPVEREKSCVELWKDLMEIIAYSRESDDYDGSGKVNVFVV